MRALAVSSLLGGASQEAHVKQSMERMPTVVHHHEIHKPRREQPFLELEHKKNEKIQKIGMADYAGQIRHLERAFQEGHTGVCACIDERMPGGQLRLAGNGILLPGGAREAAEVMAAFGKKTGNKIKKVVSHEGCGAAALAKKDAKAFATEVAAIMTEMTGEPVVAEHLGHAEMRPGKGFYSPEEMKEVPDYHFAQAAYLDLTGRFNPAAVRDLPAGFVSSDLGLEGYEQIGPEGAVLAARIALGDHGLGDFFTPERPFRINIVAKTEAELASAAAAMEPLVAEFGKRVAVDGFVAPAEQRPN